MPKQFYQLLLPKINTDFKHMGVVICSGIFFSNVSILPTSMVFRNNKLNILLR